MCSKDIVACIDFHIASIEDQLGYSKAVFKQPNIYAEILVLWSSKILFIIKGLQFNLLNLYARHCVKIPDYIIFRIYETREGS